MQPYDEKQFSKVRTDSFSSAGNPLYREPYRETVASLTGRPSTPVKTKTMLVNPTRFVHLLILLCVLLIFRPRSQLQNLAEILLKLLEKQLLFYWELFLCAVGVINFVLGKMIRWAITVTSNCLFNCISFVLL